MYVFLTCLAMHVTLRHDDIHMHMSVYTCTPYICICQYTCVRHTYAYVSIHVYAIHMHMSVYMCTTYICICQYTCVCHERREMYLPVTF